MTTRTETLTSRTAAGAAVLALLLIPTLACAATESTGSATGASAQGDLIGMLPADVVTVGYLDYATLRSSAIYDMITGDEEISIDAFDDLEEFVARTGMDPRTDIHRVAFATGRVGFDSSNDGVMVVSASFDRVRMESALEEFETTSYQGETIWRVRTPAAMDDGEEDDTSDEAGDEADENMIESRGYLALMGSDTMAMGSLEMVQAVLDVRSGGASARTNEGLAGLIEDVDPDSQIWFVSAQDRLVADLAPRDEGGPTASLPVDRIRSLIFSARLTDGLAMQLRGRTPAEADAKLLGDSLNGMLAFGKMMVQSNAPEIFAILDGGVRAGSSGRDVTVRADLTVEEIEQLRSYLERTFQEQMEGVGDPGD